MYKPDKRVEVQRYWRATCSKSCMRGSEGGIRKRAAMYLAGYLPYVIEEEGRPERAWDADGDHDLDFDRDTLFAHLADLGIVFTKRQAYVCP